MNNYKKDSVTPDAHQPPERYNRYDAPTLYINGEWNEYGPDKYAPDVNSDYVCSFIDKHKDEPFLYLLPDDIDACSVNPDTGQRRSGEQGY